MPWAMAEVVNQPCTYRRPLASNVSVFFVLR